VADCDDLRVVEDLVSRLSSELDAYVEVSGRIRDEYGMDLLTVVHGSRPTPRDRRHRDLLIDVLDRYVASDERPALLTRTVTHLIAVFGGASPQSIVDQIDAHARDLNPGTWLVLR